MSTESTFGTTDETPIPDSSHEHHTPLFDKSAHRRNLHNAQNALIDEFHTLIGDTERLLKHTQETAGVQSEELRGKINENLARAKALLKEREASMREQSQAAIQCTEDYVQNHPWQSVGIAAGVGFLLGLLSSRR
ncbi:DUF883 family protein [Pseudomonas stutzeri]|uniref:DUF883 family protein n=1 Tax=Pseudomonas TaxID=286 RepID=UPI001F22BF85|nr:DUF883 family protein [Pseudomonas phenolilytica]MCQ4232094.1 DUF883 family protein [Stutzerimonas degradans]MCQ4269090.1 DUF883 family protein [Stutzerimonas degradans]UIP87959.1 DUF883 domain-containing protein [Pseudomonas phenolilytica]